MKKELNHSSPMYQIDSVDRELLRILQGGLPVCSHPYAEIADRLGISEDEVLRRIAVLKDSHIIRRLTGFFDSKSLGYTSALLAMHVEEQDIEKMAELLNTIPGVTHNYIRTHELNMWFTLTVDSEDSFKSVVDRIEASKLTRRVIRLAQSEQFKIGVSFDLGGDR